MQGVLNPEIQDIVRGTIEGPDPGEIWICNDGIPEWVQKRSSSDNPYSVTIIYSIWFKPDQYTWYNIFHEIKHCEQFYVYRKRFLDVYSLSLVKETPMVPGYETSYLEKEADRYATKMTNRVIEREIST